MIIIKRYRVKALGPAPVVKAYAPLISTEATLYSNNAGTACNNSVKEKQYVNQRA